LLPVWVRAHAIEHAISYEDHSTGLYYANPSMSYSDRPADSVIRKADDIAISAFSGAKALPSYDFA
jgi:hypothetical protein